MSTLELAAGGLAALLLLLLAAALAQHRRCRDLAEKVRRLEAMEADTFKSYRRAQVDLAALNARCSAFSLENDRLKKQLSAVPDQATAAELREQTHQEHAIHCEALETAARKAQEARKQLEGDLQFLRLQLAESENSRQTAERRLAVEVRSHADVVADLDAAGRDAAAGLARERDASREKAEKLEEAIIAHRNARGHQRCLLNDLELYAALGVDVPSFDPAGGQSLPELMAGCAAYWIGQLGLRTPVPDKMRVDKKDVTP